MVPNWPIFKTLSALRGPKLLNMGSKWDHSTCLCNPNSPKVCLEKHIFGPIFDSFLVPKQPIFKAFCESGGAKMACNGLKKGSFHLFRHPKWSRIIVGKTRF